MFFIMMMETTVNQKEYRDLKIRIYTDKTPKSERINT